MEKVVLIQTHISNCLMEEELIEIVVYYIIFMEEGPSWSDGCLLGVVQREKRQGCIGRAGL